MARHEPQCYKLLLITIGIQLSMQLLHGRISSLVGSNGLYSCNSECRTPTTIPNVHCWLSYDFACKMINSSTSGMALAVCHTKTSVAWPEQMMLQLFPTPHVISMQASIAAQSRLSMVSMGVHTFEVRDSHHFAYCCFIEYVWYSATRCEVVAVHHTNNTTTTMNRFNRSFLPFHP
jgi:hypothetical protein